MLYTMPVLLIILFLGKDLSPLFLIAKFIALLVIVILIKNTSPRVRIDQALRFFWRLPALSAIIAIILALFGF
jgi:NADH-quinone oxidoreductase subunit H